MPADTAVREASTMGLKYVAAKFLTLLALGGASLWSGASAKDQDMLARLFIPEYRAHNVAVLCFGSHAFAEHVITIGLAAKAEKDRSKCEQRCREYYCSGAASPMLCNHECHKKCLRLPPKAASGTEGPGNQSASLL